MPFKLNQHRRHHIPKQKYKLMNSRGALLRSWRAYDASLRQRGSLTVWFTDEATQGWRAEPRTTQGGQPWYSSLAILTALTLRSVFRLALRQTEGLIWPCRTTQPYAAERRRSRCHVYTRAGTANPCIYWCIAPA